MSGRIELITGCMASGKTSQLIHRIERLSLAEKKCVVIKWKGDTRYGEDDYVMTHDRKKLPCIPCDDEELGKVYERVKDYDVIGIDEGSFFRGIVEFCEMLANKGHVVIVASLIGTFQREGFGDILNLIPKCDDVVFLKAVCMSCKKNDAPFTSRTTEYTEVMHVGGMDDYKPLCRKCFMESKGGQ